MREIRTQWVAENPHQSREKLFKKNLEKHVALHTKLAARGFKMSSNLIQAQYRNSCSETITKKENPSAGDWQDDRDLLCFITVVTCSTQMRKVTPSR